MGATFRMDAAERAALERDGYVLRTGVFDPAECAGIAGECEALVKRITVEKQRTKLRVGGYMIEFEREFEIVVSGSPRRRT
jgi:hypothetical protein